MKRLVKWSLLLNKRLYKKTMFLLILVLIPVLVLGYGQLAREESGVLTVALAQKGDDPMAKEIMEELKAESSLIRYILCKSPEEAKKLVNESKANAAWIFEDNLEEAVYRFVSKPTRSNAFIRVLEGNSNTPLRLAREKLSGAVFSHCSRVFYLQYLRENVPQLADTPDETLLAYYDDFAASGKLFEYANAEGEAGDPESQKTNYLLNPVRGLLAIVIVLGGLAAAMFYISDSNAGTFALVPINRRWAVEFACQLIAVVNVSVVALAALLFGGLAGNIAREILLLVLYALAVCLFCMNVRRFCRSLGAVGTALPLLVVIMLAACPVFFDYGSLRYVQYLLPPTYYINGAYSDYFLLLLPVYIAVLVVIYALQGKLLRKD